ncbi:hypothetical protein HHI36_015116 [Cryptolaemus montrouzieri]|uniref:Transcription factor CBF/NF-Y/archaeal histone domain-containing protein n=1 Tax=Cryptolaemus montrouzieri TaxID=559131 RepID=A0ABD2N5U4_9CUCU
MAGRTSLPLTRVCTIMKSSSDVENVGKESTIIMAKAAELFIKKLVMDGYNTMRGGAGTNKTLQYQFLAEIVQSDDKYEFLRDMMPKKITVREYKKIMAKKNEENGVNKNGNSSDSSDSDSEDSSSSSSTSGDSVISVHSA